MRSTTTGSNGPADADLIRLGGKPSLRQYLPAIWARRHFAAAVAAGEVRSQHMDTALGNVWHVVNPMLLVAVYYLMFGVILNLSRGVDNFITFLVVGIFVFHYSTKSIINGSRSVVGNDGLVRSIRFPRAILPISTTLGQTLTLGPAVAIMVIVALLTGERPHLTWFLLVPMFGLQALANMGASFFVARFTDRFHDVQFVLPYVFRLLFYLSGVLYSVDQFVPGPYRVFFDVNPFYAFVTIARSLVLDGRFAGRYWAIATVWTLIAFVSGLLFFRNAEHEYGRG